MDTEFKESPSPETAQSAEPKKVEYASPAQVALVKKWIKEVQASEKHWSDIHKQMDECMNIAAKGGTEEWTGDKNNYVVPIINRHINLAVSQLYARDPRATAKRRRRLMYQIWDGDPNSLQAAMAAISPPPDAVTDPVSGQVFTGPPEAPQPWSPDPNSMALLQEIEEVRKQNKMLDKLGKSLALVFEYYAGEQANGFKAQMKQLVRRTKVCGVGWVKLLFQRERDFRPKPDVAARIDDTRSQVAALQALMRQAQGDTIEADSAKAAELENLLKQLTEQATVIVREGPLFEFPKAKEIIVDKNVRHLKTFSGARWIAHTFDKTPDEVLELYYKDIKGKFKEYKTEGSEKTDGEKQCYARLYEVQDIKHGQTFVVCDGYDDWIVAPQAPDVQIERFFTIFPLVFNEVEHDKQVFPPSDVWQMRHAQDEYNRSRQGLREHRRAARPRWGATKGALSEPDKKKLESGEAFALLELQALKPGTRIEDILQPIPNAKIDPSIYEVENYFIDAQRTTGTQEANFGGMSKGSATEASISEQSRNVSISDNVDDLDDLLTEIARATGHLCLLELSAETVKEIAGPGAVWPSHDMSREEIAKDLYLNIKAASTGRPNKAADLANLDRAATVLLQVPGMNPKVLAERYCEALDIDLEDAFVEGLPSITALNNMMGRGQPSTGDPATDPNNQGAKGGNNAPKARQDEPQGQPAYPSSADQPVST